MNEDMVAPLKVISLRRFVLDVLSICALLVCFFKIAILARYGDTSIWHLMITGIIGSTEKPALAASAIISGWAAVALNVASIFLPARMFYVTVNKIALTLLLASWSCFVALNADGPALFFSLIISIPFGCTVAARIAILYYTNNRQ